MIINLIVIFAVLIILSVLYPLVMAQFDSEPRKVKYEDEFGEIEMRIDDERADLTKRIVVDLESYKHGKRYNYDNLTKDVRFEKVDYITFTPRMKNGKIIVEIDDPTGWTEEETTAYRVKAAEHWWKTKEFTEFKIPLYSYHTETVTKPAPRSTGNKLLDKLPRNG